MAVSHSQVQKVNSEGASARPGIRSYQLTEKRYLDTRSSAYAMFGVGIALLYGCAALLIQWIRQPSLFPGGLSLSVLALLCLSLFWAGSRSLKRSHQLKDLADEERRLANELIEWFITTYSAEQIDDQIGAITTLTDSPEILCLKRLDMIRILIDREYERSFDDEFLDQICEDIYNMSFEDNTMS